MQCAPDGHLTAARLAILVNLNSPLAEPTITDAQAAASATGWKIEVLPGSYLSFSLSSNPDLVNLIMVFSLLTHSLSMA